jgi:hypothetical protein
MHHLHLVLQELKLLDHLEAITKVADVAGKEFSIEVALDKMQREWEGAELQVLDYRETKTFIVKVGVMSGTHKEGRRSILSTGISRQSSRWQGKVFDLFMREGCSALPSVEAVFVSATMPMGWADPAREGYAV